MGETLRTVDVKDDAIRKSSKRKQKASFVNSV
jgi:hypothetical protein